MGVVGAGQLARMLQGPAVELGVQLSVLAESADASAALVVPSAPVGDHTGEPVHETGRFRVDHAENCTYQISELPPHDRPQDRSD